MDWDIEAFIKLARKGAICLLPTRGGKYLMQDDAHGTDFKSRLRPPGGGFERGDKDLTDTIVRELQEEFAIPESESRDKIKFLGFTHQKKYWGTPVYLLKGHGLKPGVYQASNHPDEKVKLVEVALDHPNYTGPRPDKLITEWAKGFGDRLMAKQASSPRWDYIINVVNAAKQRAVAKSGTDSFHGRFLGDCGHLISQCRCSGHTGTVTLDVPCFDCSQKNTGQEKKAGLFTVAEVTERARQDYEAATGHADPTHDELQEWCGHKLNQIADEQDKKAAIDEILDEIEFDKDVWEYSELTKDAIVKEEGGKFKLYTRDGARVLGTHDSYEHALAQERAIQIRKHLTQTAKTAAANASEMFKQIVGGKAVQIGQQQAEQAAQAPAGAAAEVDRERQIDYGARLRKLRLRRGEDPETGQPLPDGEKSARYITEEELLAWGRSPEEGRAAQKRVSAEYLRTHGPDDLILEKESSGFHKPENYDPDKTLSTAHYKIWLGENDWESVTTWAWVTMGRDGQDIGRVWLRLDPPKELIDSPKFNGDWGRDIIRKWIERAKAEAQKRADELEVDNSELRLDDFEAAAEGLAGVKEFGQEKTTWVEKQAAAIDPSVEQMVQIPTTGPEAIAHALRNVDLTKKEAEAKQTIARKLKSKRPDAIRMLGYLEGFKRSGMKPEDLIMDKVPVIPPQFRPYTVAGDTFVPGDANELYRDLINLKDVHGDLEAKLGQQGAGFNRLNIYDAVKALYGYGNPTSPKTKERGVSGFLKKITGTSPKFSFGMRRLIGRNLDYVGRGVIAVDPDLGLDEVGVPDEMLWKMYAPYVQRRLVRHGMKMEQAVKSIEDRNEHASKMLDLELKERPVMYTRDPAWHKFNATGGWPKRIAGTTVMINPLVTSGHGADFDGDTMGIHVPSLDAAVDDVKNKLMPSKMLFSIKDRNKVVPVIKHEQILGLHQAQHRTAKNSWAFPDQSSALKAIKSGQVSLSDEVNIGAPNGPETI